MNEPDTTDRSTARTVTIPDHLADRIDSRIEGTRFDSHEEYVVEALTQLLLVLETETEAGQEDHESSAANPDEDRTAQLENQLESLGYL